MPDSSNPAPRKYTIEQIHAVSEIVRQYAVAMVEWGSGNARPHESPTEIAVNILDAPES